MDKPKSKPAPSLSEIGKTFQIPEIPKAYRSKLWRTLKVKLVFDVPEETEHFLNMLCLHFGLSRSQLLVHAINLLWSEFLHTADPERIKLYEEKLEAVRLWRLESNESRRHNKAVRIEDAIKSIYKCHKEMDKIEQKIETWSYNKRKSKYQISRDKDLRPHSMDRKEEEEKQKQKKQEEE